MRILSFTLAIGLLCTTQALADSRTDQINRIITQLNPDAHTTQADRNAGASHIEIIVQSPNTYFVSDYDTSADFPVYFALNSAKLTQNGKALLDVLAAAMLDDTIARHRYLIAGHTDAKGSAAYNLQLSRKRANSVRRYLVEQGGIDPYRLITIGWGEARLKNAARPNAAINRRVEVSYVTNIVEAIPAGTSITVWQGTNELRKSQIVVGQISTRFPELIVSVGGKSMQSGSPVTIENRGSNTVITVPNTDASSNKGQPNGVTIVMPAGKTKKAKPSGNDNLLDIQAECARRLANDPRSDQHKLDDFNSGKTPLNCEDYMEPIAPSKQQGIGSKTRIKIN